MLSENGEQYEDLQHLLPKILRLPLQLRRYSFSSSQFTAQGDRFPSSDVEGATLLKEEAIHRGHVEVDRRLDVGRELPRSICSENRVPGRGKDLCSIRCHAVRKLHEHAFSAHKNKGPKFGGERGVSPHPTRRSWARISEAEQFKFQLSGIPMILKRSRNENRQEEIKQYRFAGSSKIELGIRKSQTAANSFL